MSFQVWKYFSLIRKNFRVKIFFPLIIITKPTFFNLIFLTFISHTFKHSFKKQKKSLRILVIYIFQLIYKKQWSEQNCTRDVKENCWRYESKGNSSRYIARAFGEKKVGLASLLLSSCARNIQLLNIELKKSSLARI